MQVSTNPVLTTATVASMRSTHRQDLAGERNDFAPVMEYRAPQTYDFTQMTRREFDQLWKAGEINMDLPPLILPEGGLDLTKDTKTQIDAVYDNEINFINYYQKSIAFQKSLPQTDINRRTLEHYETGLNALMALQGKARQSRINVEA